MMKMKPSVPILSDSQGLYFNAII